MGKVGDRGWWVLGVTSSPAVTAQIPKSGAPGVLAGLDPRSSSDERVYVIQADDLQLSLIHYQYAVSLALSWVEIPRPRDDEAALCMWMRIGSAAALKTRVHR
ncbi:hypothetical protein BC567DRAFT_212257 [Phyllosticta citribraziliensis]